MRPAQGGDFGTKSAALAAPAGGRSWYIANNVSTSVEEKHWRLVRFERRQRSSGWLIGAAREAVGLAHDSEDGSDWVRPPRPARCRWRVASVVGVHAPAGEHGAHFSGLERCGSIWSCPVCAAVIRAERAREIAAALESAHRLGHGIAFATLTLRHTAEDALADNLDALLEAWRKVQMWRDGRALFTRLGHLGTIRAVEVTLGFNGWHPHAHLALIFDRPLSELERVQLESQLAAIWVRAVEKVGARLPSLEHGVNVQLADGDGVQIAGYLAKVQETVGRQRLGIAKELARGDLKRGRAGSATPFELLDDETGNRRTRALWAEYVAGTKGRRAFGWSRGLREYLLPEVEEKTDDEVLDEAESGDLVGLVDAESWDREYRDNPALMHRTLSDVEGVNDDDDLCEDGQADVQRVRFEPDPVDNGRCSGVPREAGDAQARVRAGWVLRE